MLIERFLQIAVCVTVILSATLLGMGQNEPSLPVMVSFFTMLALLVTDIFQIFSLNRVFQNLVTLGAMFVALGHFTVRFAGVDQIVAIANLLVYLEIILLFRKKDIHTYWQLVLLSFLQVVVAAAFPQTFTFGVLLVMYLMLMLITVALLSATKRQQRMARGTPERFFRKPPPEEVTESAKNNARVAHDQEKHQILRFEWLRRLFGIGMCSVLLGLMVFFLTPRRGEAFTYGMRGMTPPATGFSNSVQLGHLGTMLQDRKEAMRVSLSAFLEAGVPDYIKLQGIYSTLPRITLTEKKVPMTLYLRGTVLNSYEDGKWKITTMKDLPPSNPTLLGQKIPQARENPKVLYPPPENTPLETLTAVEITCETLQQRELVTVSPFYMLQLAQDESIRYDPGGNRLYWDRPVYEYTLLTRAIQRNAQVPLTPCEETLGPRSYLQLPKNKMPDGTLRSTVPTLEAVAAQWRSQLSDPGVQYTTYEIATHLARQFHVIDDFRYSLRGRARDPDMDPCEDFIRNNRVGHCEYFSTALALMLRAEGIPARVVVGFCTTEFISQGNFYVVRNSDAHAWVEAWIPRKDIPDYILKDSPWEEAYWKNGGWLRLEPTPDTEEEVGAVTKVLDSAGGWLDWYEVLWNTYVIKMNASRQMEAVYDPIKKIGQEMWDSLANTAAAAKTRRSFIAWVSSTRGQVTLLAAGVFLAVSIIFWKRWWRLRQLRRLKAGKLRKIPGGMKKKSWFGWTREESPVDFYLHFEMLLKKKGVSRGNSQTSRELAKMAEEKMPPEVLPPEIVAKIVETYYRIRFGHQTPTEETLGEMRHCVEKLAK